MLAEEDKNGADEEKETVHGLKMDLIDVVANVREVFANMKKTDYSVYETLASHLCDLEKVLSL